MSAEALFSSRLSCPVEKKKDFLMESVFTSQNLEAFPGFANKNSKSVSRACCKESQERGRTLPKVSTGVFAIAAFKICIKLYEFCTYLGDETKATPGPEVNRRLF